MKKVRSIIKKVYNVDLAAYKAGKRNYQVINDKAEALATERAKICAECEKNEIEPIDELSIPDERIPGLSGRMCDMCGCSLPYLLRQSIEPCKLKKW